MNNYTIRNTIFGALVVLVGIAWLIANLMDIQINLGILWPLLVLIPGVIVLVRYIITGEKRQAWRFLLVGSFLTVLGLALLGNAALYYYAGIKNIWFMTLFIYPAIGAFSLWISWAASGRKITLLIAAVILTAVAVLITCFMIITSVFNEILGPENIELLNGVFWPLLSMGIGLTIIVWPFIVRLMRESRNEREKPASQTELDSEETHAKISEHDDNA